MGKNTSKFWRTRGKLCLTGEISKALGTYDEHLKGAVEYLLCGPGGKEYESIIVVNSSAQEIHDAMLKLGVERGTPPMYDEEKDEMIGATGASVLLFVEWEAAGRDQKGSRGRSPLQHANPKTDAACRMDLFRFPRDPRPQQRGRRGDDPPSLCWKRHYRPELYRQQRVYFKAQFRPKRVPTRRTQRSSHHSVHR